MADLAAFAQNMRDVAKAVTKNATKAQRTAALACDQVLVVSTPVDTGRARVNWLVGIGAARTDVLDAPTGAKASKGGTSLGSTTGVAESIAAASSAIEGATGAPIHITNNLPYIVPLNQGHSKQAPAGFIEAGIQAAVASLKGVRLLDK